MSESAPKLLTIAQAAERCECSDKLLRRAAAYAALDMEPPPATAPLIKRYIATTEQADED